MASTVVVCDDHPIFRNGVIATISQRPDLQVVAEASDGTSCLAKLEIFAPDILVCDLSMPILDGFQVLEWIRDNQPSLRTFILSMHTDLPIVMRAKELGANGFLAKEDAQSDLLSAIDGGSGNFYTSQSIGSGSTPKSPSLANSEIGEKLKNVSSAERRVLELLANEMTSKEIAAALSLSVRTVEAHRASLATKLDVNGRNKLTIFAIRHRDHILGQ